MLTLHDLKGIYIIWLRDVKRFWRDKPRIIGAVAQPTLYLFVLGTGLSSSFRQIGDIGYVTFVYPGIIGMTVLFTSIFSAISIIWDREFGFLKEVLVAPISRTSVALGKALGGSTISMFQGTIMLVFAPVLGIKLTPGMIVQLILLMLLVSMALTSMGIVVAARMRSMEGFQMIMNFLLMPMFFLSGAMFPLAGLPGWMSALVSINPLTYGIDAIRYTVIGIGAYSMAKDVLLLSLFCLTMLVAAIYFFGRQD